MTKRNANRRQTKLGRKSAGRLGIKCCRSGNSNAYISANGCQGRPPHRAASRGIQVSRRALCGGIRMDESTWYRTFSHLVNLPNWVRLLITDKNHWPICKTYFSDREGRKAALREVMRALDNGATYVIIHRGGDKFWLRNPNLYLSDVNEITDAWTIQPVYPGDRSL